MGGQDASCLELFVAKDGTVTFDKNSSRPSKDYERVVIGGGRKWSASARQRGASCNDPTKGGGDIVSQAPTSNIIDRIILWAQCSVISCWRAAHPLRNYARIYAYAHMIAVIISKRSEKSFWRYILYIGSATATGPHTPNMQFPTPARGPPLN